jgi:hypothetical protein
MASKAACQFSSVESVKGSIKFVLMLFRRYSYSFTLFSFMALFITGVTGVWPELLKKINEENRTGIIYFIAAR